MTPSILPRQSLAGVDVGLSVSDSLDLERLGLTLRHAELAVAELARAVLVAGGSITYGGWINPSSFTDLLMHEVRRYGTRDDSITFCLALPEHRRLSLTELAQYDRGLGAAGHIIYLDAEGQSIRPETGREDDAGMITDPALLRKSYTGLRKYMARQTRARIIVGGQLAGFKGAWPGIIEEAMTSIEANQPIYIAGGFGGAAAAIVRALNIADMTWLPADMPLHGTDPAVATGLEILVGLASQSRRSVVNNGLTATETAALAASHRAGEIASLVALGLANVFS